MRLSCLFFLSPFLFALDIYESVELVLKHSDKLKEQEYILSKLERQIGVHQGAYYPKIDLSYQGGYNAQNRFGNKVTLGVKTNLFNGMKDYYNVQKQEKNVQAQEEGVKKVREEIKYSTKKLYVQILLAKGSLEILKESVKLLEIQHKQAEQFYKQGISAKNNVLSVEVSLASAKLEINTYTTRLNYLISSLEELMQREVVLSELKDLPLCEEEVDYDHLSLIIFEYRPEYKEMQKQKEALSYDLSIAKGAYYPKIDLGVSGDYAFGGRLYGESQASIGLGISINLFNGLRDSKMIEAKQYELLGLEAKISAYKKEILNELKKAVGDFNLAKDQYILSKKAIESAQENYRIVSNRYKQKLETSGDLLDAELMLKNARANLLKSQYAIWENLFYVEFLIGGRYSLVF